METAIPNLIFGPIALAAGILAFRFRVRLRDWTIEQESVFLGRNAAETVGRLQTPFWVGFAGVAVALIGATMVVSGIVTFVTAHG